MISQSPFGVFVPYKSIPRLVQSRSILIKESAVWGKSSLEVDMERNRCHEATHAALVGAERVGAAFVFRAGVLS